MGAVPPASSCFIRIFCWLEIAWFCVLPWLGYWIVLGTPGVHPGGTVILGWLPLLVYNIIKLGMVLGIQRSSRRPVARLLGTLLPTALLILAQWLRGGDMRGFLLELATLEFTVLACAFPVALVFLKNDQGRSAWQDLGIVPLLIAVLFGIGIHGFVAAWWTIAPAWHSHPLSLLLLIAGAAAWFVAAMGNLNRLVKREATLADISTRPVVLVLMLGQIAIWWLLPGVVALLGKS